MSESSVRIRTASIDDLDAIADLHTRSRNAYYRGFVSDAELADAGHARRRREVMARDLTATTHTVFCAELDGRIVGFAVIEPCRYRDPDPRITSECHFYVDPGVFRQGIGTRLHEACVAAWKASSTTMARLWVREFNQRARAFYASQGWEPDGHHRPDDPTQLGYRLTIDP